VGSHLCEALLKRGDDVVAVDNFFTGRKRNIPGWMMVNPGFELLRHDVTFPLYVEVDQIYNLACPASPVHYQRNPVETVKTSVHGAINMLGMAKRTKARILQASTSEVYGDPEVHPQVESYVGHVNPIGPRACYDESKRCAETLFSDYRRQHGVDARIVRIFNTYGPRMHPNDGRVVSNFITRALRDEDLTIYGTGESTRSFMFVTDLVRGLIAAMNAPELPDPVNLGNPEEITVGELARRVVELTSSRSRIVTSPALPDDPRRRKPDITRARTLLGWEPLVRLEDGLRETADWFARHPG
jgi:UDP-glucuronate decarboxylase